MIRPTIMLPSAIRAMLMAIPLALSAAAQAASQSLPDAPRPQPSARDEATLRNMPRNLLHDQAAIWSSPIHIRARDLKWLLPVGAATGAAIATDRRTLRDVVSHDPGINGDSTNASNAAIGGILALPAVFYGIGHFRGNVHARETGLLGAEAIADGLARISQWGVGK